MKIPGIPIVDWLSTYRLEWLKPDVLAGLATGALVIPKAVAFATVAGLPVEVGLYTALVPMVLYALLGTSRPLSVSTTTALAILVAAQLRESVPAGSATELLTASATLALLVGVFLAAASLLKFGFVANFLSVPVLVGFKAGIGMAIVLDQVPKLLGIHVQKVDFFRDVVSTIRALHETSIPTLAVGVAMIVLLLILKNLSPRVPAPFIAMAVGILAMKALGLEGYGVAPVGRVPSGLPHFTPPDPALLSQLWPAAMGIALMSFAESIAAARAFASADDPPVAPNRELFALGVANAGGALLGGMAAGGGATQTALNRLLGARTQLSTLATAAETLTVLLFLAPLMGFMPQATLAAVVMVYSVGLIQIADFRAILRVRKMEFTWAVAACAGVFFLGTLKGILAAIVISLLALLKQAMTPAVFEVGRIPGTDLFRRLSPDHAEYEIFPGLLLVRVLDRIFFANAEHVATHIMKLVAKSRPRTVVLDLSAVSDLEYSALKMMIEGVRRMNENGAALQLSGLNPAVKEVVQRSPLAELLGPGGIHRSLEQAVMQHLSAKEDAVN
jgi:high affinity sulfate transporter 1